MNEMIKRKIEEEKFHRINEKIKQKKFYENDMNYQISQKKVNKFSMIIL